MGKGKRWKRKMLTNRVAVRISFSGGGRVWDLRGSCLLPMILRGLVETLREGRRCSDLPSRTRPHPPPLGWTRHHNSSEATQAAWSLLQKELGCVCWWMEASQTGIGIFPSSWEFRHGRMTNGGPGKRDVPLIVAKTKRPGRRDNFETVSV